MGDSNVGLDSIVLKDFCNLYNLKSLINKPTCYKNPAVPFCIDLLLTNCSKYFQNSHLAETELSDFHKMAVTVMKTSYRKLEPKIRYHVISYSDYEYNSNVRFRQKVISQLPKVVIGF